MSNANDDAAEVARLYEMRAKTEDDEVNDALSTLSAEQKEQKRLSRKPKIEHLKDATATLEDGTVIPLFDVGDKIVAERRVAFLSHHPWLDTKVYIVRSIDDETGVAICYDEDSQHRAVIGFRHDHTVVKLCPKKGNPFKEPAPQKEVVAKKPRKQREKN